MDSGCPVERYYRCKNGECMPKGLVTECDGVVQCRDGSDELPQICSKPNHASYESYGQSYRHPDNVDPTLTIVLPTIGACVALVFLMLLGIKKCKQWETESIGQLRRSRRLMERITAILREKNLALLKRATAMRTQAMLARATAAQALGPPPQYGSTTDFPATGNSPPPSYNDLLITDFYNEYYDRINEMPQHQRRSSTTKRVSLASTSVGGKRRSVDSTTSRQSSSSGSTSRMLHR